MYRVLCIATDHYDARTKPAFRKSLDTAYALAREWLAVTGRKAVVSVLESRGRRWRSKRWRKIGEFRTAGEVPASQYARY